MNTTHEKGQDQFVWAALESSRGLISVPACWKERLGDDYESFRAAFLASSSEAAKYYPCPLGCGCMHEIVYAGEETRAVCRCDEPHCPDILLTPAEAMLLELSWSKLARALCRALNLDSRPADLGLLNTRQIGSWSADAVPVILTIQTNHAWFRGVLLELIARLRGKFIVLAPTNRHFDAVCQELIGNAGAGFFPLEGNERVTAGGALEAIKIPGELFARFTPEPRHEPGEDVAQHAFALVEQLGSESKPPTPLTVFRLYCVQGWSSARIARNLGCSRPTVARRLKLIRDRTGMHPDRLRQYSAQFDRIEDGMLDARAKHLHRKNLIGGDEAAIER
jgi:hypothetical protein